MTDMRNRAMGPGALCVAVGLMSGAATGQTFGPTPLLAPNYGTATSPGGYVAPQIPQVRTSPREIAPGVPAPQPFPSGIGANAFDPNLPTVRRRR
jgi:hypothetical protein